MKYFQFISIVISLTVLSACASRHIDMIAEGDVQVDLKNSDLISYSKIDVHQHNGKSEIQVVVRPKDRVQHFTPGTIKMIVSTPDGKHQQLISDEAHVDKHRMGSKLQHAHFFVFIPSILPSGTLLTVSYDN